MSCVLAQRKTLASRSVKTFSGEDASLGNLSPEGRNGRTMQVLPEAASSRTESAGADHVRATRNVLYLGTLYDIDVGLMVDNLREIEEDWGV
jgi:hypothetical protein